MSLLVFGLMYVTTQQNVSASGDGIISSIIEINNNTVNGPDLDQNDFFGRSIVNMGDLNGDGTSDIAVGATSSSNVVNSGGVIHIMFLNSDGTVSNTMEINNITVNGPILNASDSFGASMANIGDLNGDGVPDIAVGATSDDTYGTNTGTIHVMFMNSNGTVSRTVEINNSTVNGPILNVHDNFGSAIADIGDLNGDGVPDIAVGAYYDDAGGSNRGAIHIILLNSNGTVSDTIEINDNTVNDLVLNNSTSLGSSITNIGDLNGDGTSDIAVGGIYGSFNNSLTGAAYVMFLNSNGTVSRTVEINNSTVNGPILSKFDFFGTSIASIGDLNNDGIPDIAVGATGDDTYGTSAGVIHVMLMNRNGTVSDTIEINNSTVNGPVLNVNDNFGSAIADIGDLNGDGTSDIAAGAYNTNIDGTITGTTYVMFMNYSTLTPTITSITSNATYSGVLKVGDTILFTLVSDDDIATINGTYNSIPLSWNSIDNGTTYTATYTISEGEADQITPLQITDVTITDVTGSTSEQKNGTDIESTIDANSPIITLNGTNPQTIELGSGYTELGATTSDGSPVSIDSDEFIDAVGTYSIYYDSADTAGNNATQVVRTVNVADGIPPVITLNGTNPQTIELGSGYTELGATTSDGSPVSIDSDEFIDAVGTYSIYYDSTNALGYNATQVIRTVNVVDSTPPVITLNGANPQTIALGSGYTELGATTSDGSPVSIDSDEFIDTVGTYSIYYDSADTAGNNATQVIRTVDVIVITPPTSCTPPASGDWTISESCTVNSGVTIQGNVLVRDGSVLSIPSGVVLDIDFVTSSLTVQSGSGVLIESGGTVT